MICIEHMDIDSLSKALPAASAILRKSAGFRSHIDPDTLDLIQSAEQSGLDYVQAYGWIGCPISLRDKHTRHAVEEWMEIMAAGEKVPAPTLPNKHKGEIDEVRLKRVEERVTQACAYLWLSRRWPDTFTEHDQALHVRSEGNSLIETALRQKRIRITPRSERK